MTASRVLMFAAAVCLTATVADAGQRRSPARVRPKSDPAIVANIAKNPQVEARVKAMLPSGMTLEQASEGFRNQGQFVAALQASKSLDIDFTHLKAAMTGQRRLTLGEAIQKLKP